MCVLLKMGVGFLWIIRGNRVQTQILYKRVFLEASEFVSSQGSLAPHCCVSLVSQPIKIFYHVHH